MNERDWIHQIERLDAPEFATALLRTEPAQERALRVHFGGEMYERMRSRAAEAGTRAEPRGNVVVLHGIMGGELTHYETDAEAQGVWLKLFRIMLGGFNLLPLENGSSVRRIAATGILKRYYGEQLLSLMQQGWNTHAYWFDWRLDMREAADTLANRIREWFKGEPVHLVAHSMGGLVSRMFIHRHPDLWKAMWDEKGNGAAGGRLVMLGTPNHGSFAIPQMLFGLNGSVRKLALLDLHHSLHDLLEIVKTFTGTYQMLPSPLRMPGMDALYAGATYAPLAVEQEQLDAAKSFHAELAGDTGATDPGRMVYVAGYGQPTYTGIRDWKKLSSLDGYDVSRLGDGTVPHALGLLDGVPSFYAPVEHGAMPCDAAVMTALDEILATGETGTLPAQVPDAARGDEESARKDLALRREMEELNTLEMAAPLKAAVRSRGAAATTDITDSEREVEDLVVREFVGGARAPFSAPVPGSVHTATAMGVTASAGTIHIRLSPSQIQNVDREGDPPVDALAVGHYIGVRPAGAELALDTAISERLGTSPLLTTFTERGVLRGEIGQQFFLPDPREPARLIAIAGLGHAGRCGTPELTVVVRELAWALGRLGKRHLATVLIGSGEGNLTARDAVSAWLEGIRRALEQAEPGSGRLETITFVESSAGKLLGLHRALAGAAKENAHGLTVEVSGPPEEQIEAAAREEAIERARTATLQPEEEWGDQADSAEATRLTVDLEEHVFRYGAITRHASIPERRVILDPDLVNEANDALAAAGDAIQQAQLGRYLLKLLFPADLLSQLATAHPLAIACDATAARIHWEMIAQPEMAGAAGAGDVAYLGIHRGLTRQLRTRFASPPEPPPPASRVLRVLVVADASGTDPLPGAREEGELVCELFNRLRAQELSKPVEMRRVAEVELVALIGPSQATRTRVMQELLLRPYDILHYAGHCMYDRERPSASGWIFTGNKRLSANELSRVDQVPKFVFSNACESGVTPDRSGERSAGMAPSFAESFFARGVQDFVCTGWPVNDAAALDFAETFYTCLLGLNGRAPAPVHAALREARTRVFKQLSGRRSWGAYQHYGNPYTRVVANAPADAPATQAKAAAV